VEGLIAMLLIGWIISSISKKGKGKKTVHTTVNRPQSNQTAVQRAEYASKLRAELEKRKQELAAQPAVPAFAVLNEGESSGDAGSMMFDSSEGECICDPELEHERQEAPAPESVYAGQIGNEPIVDFSAKGILQGVVMNEILTRPAQRFRRMR